MLKRSVVATLLGVLLISGVRWRAPEPDSEEGGVTLASVLAENGCLEAAGPPVNRTETAQWPEEWNRVRMLGGDVPPARVIRDPNPTFHGVAVDPINNIVAMSDSNRHGIWVYDRTAGSAAATDTTQPITSIRGPATGMMFVASIAVDPERKEIYTVDNDIGDRLLTFTYDMMGNARPIRALHVPHQAWGIALSPKRQEVAVSVESSRMIVVYKRGADGEEQPIRTLRGVKTGLADPHGVQFDDVNNEMVVVNHGNQTWGPPQRGRGSASGEANGGAQPAPAVPMGGRWLPPSMTVFAADANGEVEPLRTIAGAQTGLNWPMGVSLDPAHGEIAVANNGDSSVLIFKRDAAGNVAPIRAIRGDKTGIVGPMNVAFDVKNDEIWVSNYGDHTAVVFPRTAAGNVAPKRILRNAPAGTPTSGFGNPGAVTYDSKRDELIVPN